MLKKIFFLIITLNFCSAFASVTINKTRVIFNESDNISTVTLSNNNTSSSIVQMWVDEGDVNANPSKIDVPFIISPQIKILNEKQSQVVKIKYIGENTIDVEELYWLNVLEIPKNNKISKNHIQLAYRTRIKFFLRSSSLSGLSQSDSAEKLNFTIRDGKISIENSSPFHITVTGLFLNREGGETVLVDEGFMIKPKSIEEINIENIESIESFKYQYINDWGGKVEVLREAS
ncbi:fimbrial biogenesis chaperone [Vibrio diabolicus]|uniref:fimbrial biogenesis chaperone n=1 Tax=Vibrio diabolicus TaxID=50719 RepID=UPI000CE96307|nr:molecular chaperone [Vibrio diabolicus]AVF61726.1 hypothetical protein AL537_20640 [Vibrio diabolicus]